MTRYLSLVVYVLLTLITYVILIYDVGDPEARGLGYPVRLLGMSLFVVSHIFMIMFWFSLLPAWLLAVRMRKESTRYFLLWGGYLVYFAPVWLGGAYEGNADGFRLLSVVSTVLFAGAVTVMIRKLEAKGARSGTMEDGRAHGTDV